MEQLEVKVGSVFPTFDTYIENRKSLKTTAVLQKAATYEWFLQAEKVIIMLAPKKALENYLTVNSMMLTFHLIRKKKKKRFF